MPPDEPHQAPTTIVVTPETASDRQARIDRVLDTELVFPCVESSGAPLPPSHEGYSPARSLLGQYAFKARRLIHAVGCKTAGLSSSQTEDCIDSGKALLNAIAWDGTLPAFRDAIAGEVQTARSWELGVGTALLAAHQAYAIPWDELQEIPAVSGAEHRRRMDFRGEVGSWRLLIEAKGTSTQEKQDTHIADGVRKKQAHRSRNDEFNIGLTFSTWMGKQSLPGLKLLIGDPPGGSDQWYGEAPRNGFRFQHYARVTRLIGAFELSHALRARSQAILAGLTTPPWPHLQRETLTVVKYQHLHFHGTLLSDEPPSLAVPGDLALMHSSFFWGLEDSVYQLLMRGELPNPPDPFADISLTEIEVRPERNSRVAYKASVLPDGSLLLVVGERHGIIGPLEPQPSQIRKAQMSDNPFATRTPSVNNNPLIRTPQRETYLALQSFAANPGTEREVGIVLPVGCGKSGCITLTPFAFKSRRTLVVAPGTNIADQLKNDFDPTRPDMFYIKYGVIRTPPYPEPVEIRGTTTNRSDLDDAHVVVTNIQQLQGQQNKWLTTLPEDYFDLIVFDEGHHSVADTYEELKKKFPDAFVVNYSATPLRADGQTMAGRVLYSYPIFRAIQEGYVKRLKALVLNPKTLKFVREEGSAAVEVSLDEVRRLGEEDSEFRRSIVTSKETLTTIVDASIRELQRIRSETGDPRHKVIAAALNFEHCRQIVQAYKARNLKVDFVHSKVDGPANKKVLKRLEQHELDVIVQVRKLGEGFDHPYLSVAAVFCVFANLSPFVQFVGRIMRVIKQSSPLDPLNQGTVVFHAGANVARRWEDFQRYSEADQEFFDQLLPLEEIDFSDRDEVSVDPVFRNQHTVEVLAQSEIELQEIPLLEDDEEAMKAITLLRARGYSPEDVTRVMSHQPVPTTKVSERQAARDALDSRVKTAAARLLAERGVAHEGRDLDRALLGRSNFVVVKAALDKKLNALVGKGTGKRSEFSRAELDLIEKEFDAILVEIAREVFGA